VQGEVEQSACSGMVLTDLVAVPMGDVGRSVRREIVHGTETMRFKLISSRLISAS
jgi:hypothetical protein